MSDFGADRRGSLDDEDRLPWLEGVDEEERSSGPSTLKLIVAVLIGLAAIGGIVGGIFWLSNRDAPVTGEPELIKAPEGDYKVRPDDPGGLTVEGEGDTAFAASAGADPKGKINTSAVPETPVDRPAAKQDEPLLKAPPPTNAGGPAIQLGAFSSEAGANSAWRALSARFSYLAPLSPSVAPVAAGGRTLYRLRANGPDAASICGRLRVAGETCVTVD